VGLIVDYKQIKEWKRPKKGEKFFWPGHNELDYLTNGYESKFVIDGMEFSCVEWYMWYQRAKAWSPNTDLACLIREAKTKELAKQLSRRCTSKANGSGTDWGIVRLRVMARAILSKFECSAWLATKLLETGESRLLYAAKWDAYYGIGFMMKDAGDRRDEWGNNYLGEMLMLVRKRLKERGER
jgi:ribA/ribD-fused uncharacterized protein